MSERPEGITRRKWMETVAVGAVAAAISPETLRAQQPGQPDTKRGKLVAIGGAMTPSNYVLPEGTEFDDYDHHNILDEIAKEVGGFKGKTAVIVMCATDENAEKKAITYGKKFLRAGAERVVLVPNEKHAKNEEPLKVLTKEGSEIIKTPLADIIKDPKTTAVFFGGGDQIDLVKRYGNTDACKAMKERLNSDENFVVIGTSAGAAAMSAQMIHENNFDEKGFGLTDIVMDQHVDKKRVGELVDGKYDFEKGDLRRTTRVNEALKLGKNTVGLAIEEGVAVMIPADGNVRVFGRTVDEDDENMPKKATFVVKGKEFPVNVGSRVPMSAVGLTEETVSAVVMP